MNIRAFINKLNNNPLLSFGVFVALSFTIYANVIHGEFLFDDNIFIQNNQFVKNADFKAIFTNGITQGSGLNDNFYRPLQQCLYVLSYKIGGNSTWAYHIWGILFHGINGFLVFCLIKSLFPNRRNIAIIVAILFVLHPVQTQAVSYISGLSEPLSAFFILSCLLAYSYLSTSQKLWQNLLLLLVSILAALLAVFSKENGILAAPLAILICLYKYKISNAKPSPIQLATPAILLLIALSFIYLKLTVLNFTGNFGLSDQTNIYNEKIWVRMFTFITILPEYFRRLVFPFGLHYETPYTAFVTLKTPKALLSLLLLFLGLAYALFNFRKKEYLPAIALMWFIIALAPVSGLIPLNSMYLEHWLYLPIIGFLLLAVHFGETILSKFSAGWMILIPICLLFAAGVFYRNTQWASAEKFYRNELKFTKKSARVYNNLAMVLADQKRCNQAVEYYQKAIRLYDVYPQSHHNMARCYEEMGMLNEAANEYFNALLIDPNFLYSHTKLPNVLLKLGDKVRAENFMKLQIAIDQGQPLSQNDIKRAAMAEPM